MAIKVGINGFGRIGRVVLRIMIEHPEQFDICGINPVSYTHLAAGRTACGFSASISS